MIYFNNILCVEFETLQQHGIVNLELWKKWAKNGAEKVRQGGNGRTSLLALHSIPSKYQEIIHQKLGTPERQAARTFKDRIQTDPNAVTFFTNYLLADGRHLEEKYIKEYCINANVLGTIRTMYIDMQTARKAHGTKIKGFWPQMASTLTNCKEEVGHTLPGSHERLYKTYKLFLQDSYSSLISKKFCNDNTVKVTNDLEKLLMSLYTMPNKPFAMDVYSLYNLFLKGKIQLVDQSTGELFQPDNFRNNKGEYIIISESTVWNVLNKPHNRAVVDSKRNLSFNFNGMHRPHHHRKAPRFAFSKISMDDRDLPRLGSDGKRVKAYYAYDVASGAVIGRAYSRSKDEELFLECMRDMFRLIETNNLGMPLEVEVENHLVNKFFDDLAFMFPFVRICNPGNSQEKHAEHFNRAKKYQSEKQLQNGIGRWWARSEAFRVDQKKVNDEYVNPVFTFESLVADDIAAINHYNNQLHKDQKRYPGKTRWQVLLDHINPNAPQVSKPVVYKAIGHHTTTTIVRNQYCTVQYAKYSLPSPHVIDKLSPNYYTVDAYYMADSDGVVNEIFLYQNNQYLCRCQRIELYNTAKAEWEPGQDDVAYTDQATYVSSFDKKVKTGKGELSKIEIIDPQTMHEAQAQEVVTVPVPVSKNGELNVDEIIADYNPDEYRKLSDKNL